jgi:hypothetical protein
MTSLVLFAMNTFLSRLSLKNNRKISDSFIIKRFNSRPKLRMRKIKTEGDLKLPKSFMSVVMMRMESEQIYQMAGLRKKKRKISSKTINNKIRMTKTSNGLINLRLILKLLSQTMVGLE